MKKVLLLATVAFSAIPALLHLHLVEKDFLEILGSSDGIRHGLGYCFLLIKNYAGINGLSGLTARPPLIPFLLNGAYALFGHTLLAVYTVYLIPRLLIAPVLFLIARRFFPVILAFAVAVLPFFFPFFETYALATLKADVFVVFFSLLATLFALTWKQSQSPHDLLAASIFLSLNVLSKETAAAFSATLGLLIIIQILKHNRHKKRNFALLAFPAMLLIGPFVLFSLTQVGRIFPSIFATARNIADFPQNIQTYLLSVLFYTGIDFELSTLISLTSAVRLALLGIGIFTVIRKKHFALLPPLVTLAAISLIDTRVIQGDIVGNREILHRIAFVVPFVALYLAFGIVFLTKLFLTKTSRGKVALIATVLFLLLQLNFVQRYFTAPFALDYTDNEFYINVHTVLTNRASIPQSQFSQKGKHCVMQHVPAGVFLIGQYRPYKVSAFPNGYKELLIAGWLVPIGAAVYVHLKQRNGKR